ncbi:MAG: bifunctional hydroxymethylpyrimidine kinase/phosphomethylpyrimidine kinase [Planctomycetota bacterium]|nr:bifunctional hydroxymethylpyrimidine kinase/phosphomethylpyrimidine kinase [Planctomycetota bacterium]
MAEAWVMAVGGVDPSGGAGLHVDRIAIEAAGLRCETFVTAQTDQDDREVRQLGARPGSDWSAECELRASIQMPVGLKFGLLPGRDALESAQGRVAWLLEIHVGLPVVLDPVLASSSGFEFMGPADLPALLDLCRRPLVLTPNLPELAVLSGRPEALLLEDRDSRLEAAAELLELGLRAVIVKDGHGGGEGLCDWLCEAGMEPQGLRRPRVWTPGGRDSIRGTGCRFASHLAAGLGRGDTLARAAIRAGDWVSEEISKGK